MIWKTLIQKLPLSKFASMILKSPLLKNCVQLLLMLMVTISCQDDSRIAQNQGKFQISFSAGNSPSGGRAKTTPSSLLVSVKDSEGTLIIEKLSITLFKFGEEYLSEPISLETGNYSLSEFLVLDENNAARYATPLEGSELAHLVTDALPIHFVIEEDKTSKIIPEVVSIDAGSANDFGYTTFSFNIIETFAFNIGILAYDETTENFELTSAHLSIKSPDDEILFNSDLADSTEQVPVKDGFSVYKLEISKAGYLSVEKVLTNDELKAFVDSNALVITLLNESVDEGLIAYYPFNGNAQDQTHNHFDGVVHGALLTTDRKGTPGAAYSFDGLNDYISVAHNNDLNLTTDFTISLWVNISSGQEPHDGINDILRKWNGNAQGYPFSISYLNPLADDLHEDKILIVRYDGQVCGNFPTTYTPTITNDTFLHIVLIKEGDKLRHYLNNVLIAEITDTTSCSVSNTADMTIGCRGNLVRFFKGKIDDIRIYSRAITAAEVSGLYAE
jgi:hypothetical protein